LCCRFLLGSRTFPGKCFDLSVPLVVQTREVDLVTATLFCPAHKRGRFFELRTIHLEKISRGVTKIQESLDAVARPWLRSGDAVVTEPGDHRQKILWFNEKRIMGIFSVAFGRTSGAIRKPDDDAGNHHFGEACATVIDVMDQLTADDFGEEALGLFEITAVKARVSESSEAWPLKFLLGAERGAFVVPLIIETAEIDRLAAASGSQRQ